MGILDSILGALFPKPAGVAGIAASSGRTGVGKSLVGEGNEVAHIDLLIGPRGSAVEKAFANGLVNNKDGFTTLLAVVEPNLLVKPYTMMFNKVTIKDAKQAVQMFGPAQYGVAKAVADSVAEGVIPLDKADDLFICVGVFIHWEAADDQKNSRTSTTPRPRKPSRGRSRAIRPHRACFRRARRRSIPSPRTDQVSNRTEKGAFAAPFFLARSFP